MRCRKRSKNKSRRRSAYCDSAGSQAIGTRVVVVEKFLWAGVIVPCRDMPAKEVEVWHDRASGRVAGGFSPAG